jgi:hypothetical protein
MRQVLAVAAAVLASAFGALILGEYQLAGTTPFVAGALFGLVVAELVLTLAKPAPVRAAQVAAVVAPGLGMVWAAWISAGRSWHYVPGVAWAGAVLAPVAAALWLRSGRRRGAGPGDGAGPTDAAETAE